MYGATLNVDQRHIRQANSNPALVQSIVTVPPACGYRQHEVLTWAEWILASTGDATPTFNRHWGGVSFFYSTHSSLHTFLSRRYFSLPEQQDSTDNTCVFQLFKMFLNFIMSLYVGSRMASHNSSEFRGSRTQVNFVEVARSISKSPSLENIFEL